AEIQGTAVPGVPGAPFVGGFAGDSLRRTAFGADGIDVAVPLNQACKGDLLAIGRPAGAVRDGVPKRRELRLVSSLAIAYPDLPPARAVRGKYQVLAIRRHLGAEIALCGRDDALRRAFGSKVGGPDVHVEELFGVDQAMACVGNRGAT